MPALLFTAVVSSGEGRGAPPHQDAPIIAVSPIELPYWEAIEPLRSQLPEPTRAAFDNAVAASFDSLIVARLTGAGFRVISGATVRDVWRRLVDSVQGYYDPLTGEMVAAEFEAVVIGTAHELRRRHAAVRWLRPIIEPVAIDFVRGRARWHGAVEGVGQGRSGRGSALSVVIDVFDSTGSLVTTNRGGLKLMFHFGSTGQMARVPWNLLFNDSKRNAKAVELAVDPLLAGLRP